MGVGLASCEECSRNSSHWSDIKDKDCIECARAWCSKIATSEAKVVRFSQRVESREVAAYSTVYSAHPRTFNFDAQGNFVLIPSELIHRPFVEISKPVHEPSLPKGERRDRVRWNGNTRWARGDAIRDAVRVRRLPKPHSAHPDFGVAQRW